MARQENDLAGDQRWQLVERIVSSATFQRSARLRELLLYLTEQSLLGRSGELTEQKIGHAVFGKPPDYSPLEDSCVRVHARQLRLRLHEYFDTTGRSETLVVEIPKGSYVPVFRGSSAPTASAESASHQEPPGGLSTFQIVPWVICVLLTVTCLLLAYRSHKSSNNLVGTTGAALPWPLSQVFDAHHPTEIVVADANYGMLRILAQKQGSLDDYLKPDFPRSFIPPGIEAKETPFTEYISDSLLTSYADVVVLTSLLDLAGPFRYHTFVRSARNLKLRDLNDGNFILLGSPSSNPWVLLFENRLNFHESEGQVGESRKAFLNVQPLPGEQKYYQGLRWTGTDGEDYADIALLPYESSEGSILILQGLQQEGTEAAGRFLANPEGRHKLSQALGLAGEPKDRIWFEALIRTKAIAGAPSSESIVAVRRIK